MKTAPLCGPGAETVGERWLEVEGPDGLRFVPVAEDGHATVELWADTDYSDLGFPGMPAAGWPEDPYDEDDDCRFCYNRRSQFHAPWCQWADARGL